MIHRDIKPDNFTIGLEDCAKITYIIDFGLAKKYRSSKTLEHTKYVNNKKLTGTARYASINALRGYEHGRRDDLESISYILIYFLKGSLPWQGLKQNKKEDRYRSILEKKRRTTAEELCFGLPVELKDFVAYTRDLGFEEEPNYNFLRKLLRQVMTKHRYKYDNIYDWSIVIKPERLRALAQLPSEEEEIIDNDDINENDEEKEEEINLNNIDENMITKPMGVNQYKFFNSIEPNKAIDYSRNKLFTNSIEMFRTNKLLLSDGNIQFGTNKINSNYFRTSAFGYSTNRNTAKITHRLTTESDCILF